MALYVNTEGRFTFADVARYLTQCQQPRMAAAVRQWEVEANDLARRYREMLAEITRLRHERAPQAPPAERVSYKSEWD